MRNESSYEELEHKIQELEEAESKRQRTEAALRKSEEQFRKLVECANDIIYTLSPDGIFTYVSPNWTEMIGHNSSAIIGQGFESFVHPDDMEDCRAFLTQVVTTGEKRSGVEYRVRHKDGSWRWHTSNASPLKDEQGRVTASMGIARDITARKKMETRFMEREEQFSTIFYRSPQPMALTEAETGELIEVNDALCKKVDTSKEQLLGRTTTQLNFYSPEDRKVFADEMTATGTVDGLEMTFTTLNGESLVAKMYATFIPVNAQNYILTIFDDITDRKRAEEMLNNALARVRNIMDSIQAGVILVRTRDRVIVDANPAAADMVGTMPEGYVTRFLRTFSPAPWSHTLQSSHQRSH